MEPSRAAYRPRLDPFTPEGEVVANFYGERAEGVRPQLPYLLRQYTVTFNGCKQRNIRAITTD
jgi:hypothetical protein